jgi:soluble lytic murein transglycosylase-like protein
MIAIALASAIACGTLTPAVERTMLSVDPRLVHSVIANESGFNPRATSKAGAQGLMQLMPSTARGLKVCNAYDPGQNLVAGTRHLRGLLDYYHGDVRLAVAAYNAGSGAVDKYHDVPPYRETQQYVARVLGDYAAYVNRAPEVLTRVSGRGSAASSGPRAPGVPHLRPRPSPSPEFAQTVADPTNLAVRVK